MKSEQEFYQSIKPHLLGHVQRVENSAANGMPDISIAYAGKEIWVELKVADPKILLRKEQYAWSMRRSQCGGEIFVLALEEEAEGETIAIWKFPDIHVRAHGTAGKYVEVFGIAKCSIYLRNARHELMNILFPDDKE